MSILDLSAAPTDPIERIMWLTGVQDAVSEAMNTAWSEAYFQARLEGRLDLAIQVGPHSKKRVLAYTRSRNNRFGRAVRWGDGVDPTSTAYYR